MGWLLHRYRSERVLDDALRLDEITGQTGDSDVDQLITLLSAGGVYIVATAVFNNGNELQLLVEESGERVLITDVGSLHHVAATSMTATPAEERRRKPPRLVDPNPAVGSPRPAAWTGLELLDDKTALVSFTHGPDEALHSVDVLETSQDITVTVHVGKRPDIARRKGGLVQPALIVGCVRIRLQAPIAGRCFRDGAGTNDRS